MSEITRCARGIVPTTLVALTACAFVGGVAAPAAGQIVLGVSGLGGEETITVMPGETFSFQVTLTTPNAEQFDTAVFRLSFTEPGLVYGADWYDWQAPFADGGTFDFTEPPPSAGSVITVDTFTDAVDPLAIDVRFENLLETFGDLAGGGHLATATFTVPLDFPVPAGGETTLFVRALPELFFNGVETEVLDVEEGAFLRLVVVPAPGAFSLAAVAAAICARRRRRAS
ncbi:MAG: hypothetical protein AAF235_01110 [Planctomycetota bacterium]